jgi:hypothetical protein
MDGEVLGVRTDRMRSLYFRNVHSPISDFHTDRELVHLVIEHAKKVIAHPTRPQLKRIESFMRNPFAEIALDETIEDSPFLNDVEELLVEVAEEKPFTCVCMLDASSSMSGDKHLLASIAVAVLLLEVPSRDASVIVFSSDAQSIKKLSIAERTEDTVLKFLKVRPRGFTNIDRGLDEGLKQFSKHGARKRRVGLIATDGRATEGMDPLIRARDYDFLVVLHLHGPGSHLEASRQMAHEGHGVCLEVEQFEELPKKLYEAIRMLARL